LIVTGHDELDRVGSWAHGFAGDVHDVLRIDGAEGRVKRCGDLLNGRVWRESRFEVFDERRDILRRGRALRPQEGKPDTRRHEHLITENGKQLASALGVNMGAAHTDGHDQGMTPEAEMAMTPETGPAVEIREVDEELEAAQIEM